jgi:hypothetical protein
LAHPAYLREKAREMRVMKKLTIDELAERLALHRSTIYYWVRDIPIPRTRYQSLAQSRAARSNRANFQALRDAAYDEGLVTYAFFHIDPLFRDFVCLYIAEGYKRNRNCVSIGNSDDLVIKVSQHWMNSFSRNKLEYNLQYHADQNLSELRNYWGAKLGIDPESIKLQRKSNSRGLAGRTWRSRYGVMSIRTNDTYFRSELQAWMDCVRDEWVLD